MNCVKIVTIFPRHCPRASFCPSPKRRAVVVRVQYNACQAVSRHITFEEVFMGRIGQVTDWIGQTNCPFHLQDDPDECGPAACMMVLAALKVDYKKLDQCKLFKEIQAGNYPMRNSGWLSDPYGVEKELNSLTPNVWQRYFQPDILTATRDVVYSIRQHSQPPLVLALGGEHWEVVDSVATDKDPVLGDFHIDSLWLHNP